MVLRLLAVVVVIAGLAAGALHFVLLEDRPLVAEQPPPSPEDVIAARRFVTGVRAATKERGGDPFLPISVGELEAVMRLAARFWPGIRSQLAAVDGAVYGEASLPVPWIGGRRWLNLRAMVPPFQGQVRPSAVAVGPVDVPPELAVWAGRTGGNLIMGDRAGDRILSSARAMTLDGDEIVFTMELDEASRGSVITGFFDTLRGDEMPPPAQIDGYYEEIREAMERGELAEEGSFLPYLRFALGLALRDATDATLPNDYTAAVFALTKTCGAKDFTLVVGRLAGDNLKSFGDWTKTCERVTFNGRIDSRRHFITSAAVKAASNRGVAISIGEFKELYDTLKSGGFDFTDIAANNSGIRMSDYLMALPVSGWADALARIETENDVIVPFEGIPSIMPEEEFRARYGDVETPEYYAVIADIEARIDRIALHAGG